jgi:hypothetical protein
MLHLFKVLFILIFRHFKNKPNNKSAFQMYNINAKDTKLYLENLKVT